MADANTPSPSDASSSGDAPKGFTLDLSTGKPPSRRKRKGKGPVAVVQQTINLSTPKSEKPAEPKRDASQLANAPTASGKPQRSNKGKSGGHRKERSAPRSGNSLADLLDPETLARLRGE